jgi:hypothetical protein
MTADLVILRRPETIGDIVDAADAVPTCRVMAEMRRHYDAAFAQGGEGREFMRHLMLASRLSERLIFEIYEVPKRRSHRIGGVQS